MHGGSIYGTKIRHDFSVNINPMGFPVSLWPKLAFSISKIRNYPDIECGLLIEKIGENFGIASGRIVAGNGATQIIDAAIQSCRDKTALCIVPSFTGYKNLLEKNDFICENICLSREDDFSCNEKILEKIKDRIRESKPGVVIVANPNNPNGKVVPLEILREIDNECLRAGSIFLIDECFIELTDSPQENSYFSSMSTDSKTIILRAFTKTFAIPGIRLGYGICSSDLIANGLKNKIPEWSTNVLAQIAGVHCLKNQGYLNKARKVIFTEKSFLSKELSSAGFKVYGSDGPFILFETDVGFSLYEKLLSRKILIRDCSDYEGLDGKFYRVAVKRHKENKILIKTIREVLKNEQA